MIEKIDLKFSILNIFSQIHNLWKYNFSKDSIISSNTCGWRTGLSAI